MTIRDSMFSEIRDKNLFEKANSFAMTYVENAFERNVYPTEQALTDLSKFEENMPVQSGNAEQILDLLNRYGSPATISQIGGRYYGFVNGGVVPAALAVRYLSDFWDQNTPLYVTSPIVSKLET